MASLTNQLALILVATVSFVPSQAARSLTLAETALDYRLTSDATVLLPRGEAADQSTTAPGAQRKNERVVVEPPGLTLAGYVVDHNGAPIVGARVCIRRPISAAKVRTATRSKARLTRTDRRGRFLVGALEAASYELRVTATGFLSSPPMPIELFRQDIDHVTITLIRTAGLNGRVLDAQGAPIDAAQVAVGDSTARTRIDGSYRLDGIPIGLQNLEVWHQDHGAVSRQVVLEIGMNHLDVHFGGGQSMTGLVRDDEGNPLRDALISLARTDKAGLEPYEASSTFSGEFAIPSLEAGNYRIRCEKPNYRSSTIDEVSVEEDRPIPQLTIVMTRGAEIDGYIYGLEAGELSSLEVIAVHRLGAIQAGRVSTDGHYSISGLEEGAWLIKAFLPGQNEEVQALVVLEKGDRHVTEDLEFGNGYTLAGHVALRGSPLPEAVVTLSGSTSPAPRQVTTDADGWFRIMGVGSGEYLIGVVNVREAVIHNELLPILGDTELRIDLEAARLSGSVASAAESRPVSDVIVYLHQLVGADSRASVSLLTAATDEHGIFSFPRVATGEYRLSVRAVGYAEIIREVQVAGSVDQHLTLSLLPR